MSSVELSIQRLHAMRCDQTIWLFEHYALDLQRNLKRLQRCPLRVNTLVETWPVPWVPKLDVAGAGFGTRRFSVPLLV